MFFAVLVLPTGNTFLKVGIYLPKMGSDYLAFFICLYSIYIVSSPGIVTVMSG